jgi:hypothetical protein
MLAFPGRYIESAGEAKALFAAQGMASNAFIL